MMESKKQLHQWAMRLAATLVLLFGMLLTARVDTSAATTEEFKFEVTVTEDSLDFCVPTSGMLNPNNESNKSYGKSYLWLIKWGDGTDGKYGKYQQVNSPNTAASSGIQHVYSQAGTYCITITPYDTDDAWLAAFGFSDNTSGANAEENKKKVVSVLSPLTSKMTRTQAQIVSGDVPAYEWAYTFYGCVNLKMGAAFNLPQDITKVGHNFAEAMFANCYGKDFTMGAAFNLPQGITAVGNHFASKMFSNCAGSSFTMGAAFNLPQGIVTAGDYFAYQMFYCCYGSSFTMGAEFNLPQGITAVTNNFADGMFHSCYGSSFTMGAAFNLPQKIETAGNYFAQNMFYNCYGGSFAMGAAFNLPQKMKTAGDCFAYSMFESCRGSDFTMGALFTIPQSLTAVGNNFAKSMFKDCSGSSFAMGAAFSMPQGLTAVGNNFAESMFYNCKGNSFTMGAAFNLPQRITTVGDYFAYNMFFSCYGDSFTMGTAFNLPPGITTVGDYFAYNMFFNCYGSSFTMGADFNLPQGITTAGEYFTYNMFIDCYGSSFTMNADFNLPQRITSAEDGFACNLFNGAGGASFHINDVFVFPKDVDSNGNDNFANTFKLSNKTPLQKRMAQSIINGKSQPESNQNTFSLCSGIFKDYNYLPVNWGGQGDTPSEQEIAVNQTEYTFKSLGSGYTEAQPEEMMLYVYNLGTKDITNLAAALTSGSDFDISAGTDKRIKAGETAEFRVRLKTGLAAGIYKDSLSITANGVEPVTISFCCRVIQMPKIIQDVQQPARSEVAIKAASTALQVEVEDVTDGGTLTYQWYKNTTDSTSGGTKIGSANKPAYTPSTNEVGTFYYYVKITNIHGDVTDSDLASVVSKTARLSIYIPETAETPVITGPEDTEVTLGQAAALEVNAQVADAGTLSYQWYQNTANSNTGGSEIAGATKKSYAPVTKNAGTFYYYVKITNTNNNATIQKITEAFSNPVTLTVKPKDIGKASVTVSGSYTYTGIAIRPTSESVTVKIDGVTLARDESAYTYEVSNNINAGTAVLTVTGTGNYMGEVQKSFTIAKKGILINAEASRVAEKTYDGTEDAQLEEVAFTDLVNGETLISGQDYTISNARYNSKDVKDANTVTATIALKAAGATAKNYQLADGSFQKSAGILPLSMEGVNCAIKVKSQISHDYECGLEQFLPPQTDWEQITGCTPAIEADAEGILTGVRVENQKLIVSVSEVGEAGNQADVKISFASDNYAISDALLSVEVTDKTPVSVSGVSVESRSYNGNAIAAAGTPEFTDIILGNRVELNPVYQWPDGAAPVDAGSYSLTVTAEENSDYEVTPQVIPFTIYKAAQSITFTEPEIRYAGQSSTLEGTADSGLSVTYISSDETKAIVENGILTLLEAGEVTITAEQQGDKNHNSAESISHTFTILPARSSDARLSSLSVSSGKLTPVFDPSILNYALTVSADTASIEVTAAASDSNARIGGTGKKDIPMGTSILTIDVTAEDGTENSYQISVTRLDYTITYHLNGGNNNAQNPKSYKVGAALTLYAPTRTGYTFAGWYSDAGFRTKLTGITKDSTGNINLYAKWTANTYKITFNPNKGSVSTKTKNVTYQSAYGSLPAPKRTGYAFGGWYTKASGGSKIVSTTKVTVTSSQTLYARWSKISVKKASIQKAVNQKGKKAAVTIKKVTGASGYEIMYATNAKMKSAKKTTSTKATVTLKSLKKGKTYYIKVRAYKKDSAGKKVYGKYSTVKKVTIRK